MSNKYSLGDVQTALSPTERFEEYLRSKKMRFTQERKLLVEYVFARHEHFDANSLLDDLTANIERKHRPSRPTVYRTLADLVEAGLLRKFELDGRAVFEHDYGYPPHDHMYCTECERLIEFQSDALLELRSRVAQEHGFRAAGHQLIIQGVCAECSQAKRRAKRKQDLI